MQSLKVVVVEVNREKKGGDWRLSNFEAGSLNSPRREPHVDSDYDPVR